MQTQNNDQTRTKEKGDFTEKGALGFLALQISQREDEGEVPHCDRTNTRKGERAERESKQK